MLSEEAALWSELSDLSGQYPSYPESWSCSDETVLLEFVLTEEHPPVVLDEEESPPSDEAGGLGGLTGVPRGEEDDTDDDVLLFVAAGAPSDVSMVTRFFDLEKQNSEL